MKKMIHILALTILSASLTACFGGTVTVKSQVSTSSRGSQFYDLQKAKEAGAIDDGEYQVEKSKLLKNDNS